MRLTWTVTMSFVLCSPIALARGGTAGWDAAREIGAIEAEQLPEASGIAVSRADSNRLYHINDAGSSPSFVTTDLRGANPRTFALDVDQVTDTEDLASGICPDKGSCLYIGDIGDNKAKRSFITIHVVRDTMSLPEKVTPAFSANLTYDDGEAHNAESLAIHPAGYVYILTKENPAQFFRFPLSALKSQKNITLEKVGSLDLNPWLKGTDKPKKILPTSMDIRPDGQQIVILTRAAGLSIDLDLAKAFDDRHDDLNDVIAEDQIAVERLPMIQLPQSEAVTYTEDGAAVLYSSEIVETSGSSAPLVRIDRQK